jgi:hypothetical protein
LPELPEDSFGIGFSNVIRGTVSFLALVIENKFQLAIG